MSATPTAERARSATRIAHDVETLGEPPYSARAGGVCRYAYTPAYAATLDYLAAASRELGLTATLDPVGNLVARNRPPGQPVYALGSHADSNRNGGRYDGMLGVVTAIEVCRLNRERALDLPLQVIAFMEEESSGFGAPLLGSRIMAQAIDDDELGALRALDDGRPFAEHASAAGYAPERWRESARQLDGVRAWIELHIEQARRLQDAGVRVGIVERICGYAAGELTIRGQADHAGGTPMDARADAGLLAAECVIELERLARATDGAAVGTVGRIELRPALSNVIPGHATLSVDVRASSDAHVWSVRDGLVAFAAARARERGMSVSYSEHELLPATPLDEGLTALLERAACAHGEPYLRMPSGAAHDTLALAPRLPSAMLFVPCRDGVSHDPAEHASSADAALGAELILTALNELHGDVQSSTSKMERE